MLLIKDLSSGSFIYFWQLHSGRVLSPHLNSIKAATEWKKSYQCSLYKGPERRKSLIDRRMNSHKREKFNRELFDIHTVSFGRRETDLPVLVDIDLSKRKIQEMINQKMIASSA